MSSILWFTLLMATVVGLGQAKAGSFFCMFHVGDRGSSTWPIHLCHQQGAWSNVEHLEHKVAPIWDADVAVNSFTRMTQYQPQYLEDLNNSVTFHPDFWLKIDLKLYSFCEIILKGEGSTENGSKHICSRFSLK